MEKKQSLLSFIIQLPHEKRGEKWKLKKLCMIARSLLKIT